MKKILFVATVRSHIAQFHQPFLSFFKNSGYEVHIAAHDNSDLKRIELSHYDFFHEIMFERKPFRINNLKAFFQIRALLLDESFDIIHCHTPVGAMITRIAANKFRKNGTKVIYTAHGFHFYKGAPLVNRIIFRFIEKWLSNFTDCLITINEEDYQAAIRQHFCAKEIIKVNGVGVNLRSFSPSSDSQRNETRKIFGYQANDFVVLCAADLSWRKHQDMIIEAVNLLKEDVACLKVIFAGTGDKIEEYKQMILNLGLENQIKMIGYNREIPQYMALSDIVVSASRQEGLPLNLIEAMASGLPIVATDCRGNRDLVENGVNGFIVQIDDSYAMAESIKRLYASKDLRKSFKAESLARVQQYGLDLVLKDMVSIYKRYMN